MATKNYTTKTASLRATKADIRNLDAKKIKLNGKPIIGEIKDFRGDTATDNDIWPNGVQIDENGKATLYPLGYNKTPIPGEIGDGTDSVFKGNKIIDKNTGEILQWIDSDSLTAEQDGTQSSVTFSCESVDTSLNGLSDYTNLIFTLNGCKEFKVDMLNNKGTLCIISQSVITSVTLNAPKLGFLKIDGNIAEFNGDLSSLISLDDSSFAYKSSLTSFSCNLSSLTNGTNMFNSSSLTSFSGDLSSLVNGNYMFSNTSLTSFSGDLSSLTGGTNMFSYTSLASFSGDLSSLVKGSYMFFNTSLASFSGDLSSLENGHYMFSSTPLTSFSGDLSSLVNGNYMFSNTSLTSFSGDLSSLTGGTDMFHKCKLDAPSLANIIHTINTPTTKGTITIGLGIDNTDEARQSLAEAIWCKDWAEVNQEFTDKKWNVQWQYNGAPTSAATLDMDTTPSHIWAKLEEVVADENGNLPHYSYVSEDGSKYFNLSWYHSSNGNNEGYDYFGSLLEACGFFGIVPKEYANEA